MQNEWPKLRGDFPAPPEELRHGFVRLRFESLVPGDEARGFAPYYHFRILTTKGTEAGHINFRVGESEHVLNCAGHIGFAVKEEFRGQGLAGKACRALAAFGRGFYEAVIMTSNPDNAASIRTMEKLGG